ncbi:nuclear transport factor 2 family protein [Chloroflexota bacterium]
MGKWLKVVTIAVLVVMLATASLWISGCGGNGNGNGNGDSAVIKNVIRDMWDAFNEGNYAKALTYCTNYGDADEEIAEMEAMKAFIGNVTVKSIENINISGSTATASVTLHIAGQTDTDEVKLVKKDGSWKIDLEGDGGGETPTPTPTPTPTAGGTWSEMSSGTTSDLCGIWGSSSTDVFAVGYDGTILHYDGISWSAMASAPTNNSVLRNAWGSSSSDVFVVGFSGKIFHYNGTSWSAMDSGTTTHLYGTTSIP